MPDEVATLHDTVVSSTEPEKQQAVETADTSAVKTAVTADPDAAEIGRILLESGVTKDQLNDILEAPKALAALKHSIQNDPAEFLKMLERTDPTTGERFLESMADTYVNRYSDKGKAAGKSTDDAKNNDLMREIEALRETTSRLQTEQQRRDQAVALATAQQRYESRVDDLLSQKEIKDLNLTKSETKALRARLNSELSSDQNAVRRVSSGNFVDVPQKFKGIIEEWASDRKAQTEAEEAKRKGVQKGGFNEFAAGPNPFMNWDVPAEVSASWDATEDGFAKALERVSR